MRGARLFPASTLLFILISVWALQFISTMAGDQGESDPLVVHVGEGYPFRSIQQAVDFAPQGSEIVVHEGEYRERVLIRKGITLKEAQGETFHLAASPDDPGPIDAWGAALTIVSSSYPDFPTTIDGGTYSYSGSTYNDAAIKIQWGTYHTIRNTVIHNSSQGVWIHGGDQNGVSLGVNGVSVHGNTIKDITNHGIYVQKAWANVHENTLFSCGNGVTVAHGYQSTTDGHIRQNDVHDCDTGFWFLNDFCPDYSDNEVRYCDIGERLEDPDDPGPIEFHSTKNRFQNCGKGTHYSAIANSYNAILDSNTYEDCGTAIYSSDRITYPKMTLKDCEIRNSTENALYMNNDLTLDNLLIDGGKGCKVSMNSYLNITHSRMRTNFTPLDLSGYGSLSICDTVIHTNTTGIRSNCFGPASMDGLEVTSDEGKGLELYKLTDLSFNNLTIDSNLTSIDTLYVRSLELTGSRIISQNRSGIKAIGTKNATVSDTNVTSVGGSMVLDFSGAVDLFNCSLYSSTGDGIYTPSPSSLTVRSTSVECNLTGLNTFSEGGVVIRNSSFKSTNGMGLSLSGSNGLSMRNLSVRSPLTSIYMDSVKNGFLNELHMNSTLKGVGLADSENITISDSRIDGSGGTGITLSRCLEIKLYSVNIDGDHLEGIKPDWSTVEELDHHIPENNTFGGRPIHYSYGMESSSVELDGYGEIILANARDVAAAVDNCYPGSAYIIRSSDVDISGSNFTSGLSIHFSKEITGEGMDIFYSRSLNNNLDLINSSVRLFNSTIHKGPEPINTLRAVLGSQVDLYSTEASRSFILANDPATRVKFHHLIGLKTTFSDGVEPLSGCHYRVLTDSRATHATSLFHGTEDTTDEEGRAGPWWIPFQTVRASGQEDHITTFTVNATRDISWDVERIINSSFDHWEEFTSEDIRAPAVPQGLDVELLSPGDGVSLTWLANTDDTVLYLVYRKMDGEWSLLNTTSEPVILDRNIPNGTQLSYRVSAVDEAGLESHLSVVVNTTAWDHEPPEPPTGLAVLGYGGKNASLSWEFSESDDVEVYRIYIVRASTRADYELVKYLGMTVQDSFEVEGLNPETSYEFAVIACDEANNPSRLSNVVGINTPDITLPSIHSVAIDCGITDVTITWNTDQQTLGTLFLSMDGSHFDEYEVGILGWDHSMHVEGLSPNTRYYVYLHAVEPSGLFCMDDNSGEFYTFQTLKNTCNVMIVVEDENGAPVEGAIVSMNGTQYITDSQGRVDLGQITKGSNITLVISLEGYETQTLQFNVPSDSELEEGKVTLDHTDTADDEGGFPWWILILLIVIVLIIAIVVFILIRKKKREEGGEVEYDERVEEGPLTVDGGPSAIVVEMVKGAGGGIATTAPGLPPRAAGPTTIPAGLPPAAPTTPPGAKPETMGTQPAGLPPMVSTTTTRPAAPSAPEAKPAGLPPASPATTTRPAAPPAPAAKPAGLPPAAPATTTRPAAPPGTPVPKTEAGEPPSADRGATQPAGVPAASVKETDKAPPSIPAPMKQPVGVAPPTPKTTTPPAGLPPVTPAPSEPPVGEVPKVPGPGSEERPVLDDGVKQEEGIKPVHTRRAKGGWEM